MFVVFFCFLVFFFRGGLELSYPDVDIRSCMIIPQEFREKISHEWGPPQVRLDTAKTVRRDSAKSLTDLTRAGLFVVHVLIVQPSLKEKTYILKHRKHVSIEIFGWCCIFVIPQRS